MKMLNLAQSLSNSCISLRCYHSAAVSCHLGLELPALEQSQQKAMCPCILAAPLQNPVP